MEFGIKEGRLEKQRTDCVVAAVFEDRQLSIGAAALDAASHTFVSTVLKQGDLEGKLGSTLLLHNPGSLSCHRILLVGAGKIEALTENGFKICVQKALQALLQTGAKDAIAALTDIQVPNKDIAWKIRKIIETVYECLYTFDVYKTKKTTPTLLKRIIIMVPTKRDLPLATKAMQQGQAIGESIHFIKNLGNTPPNVCTPSYLAKSAEKLHKEYPAINVAVLDEKDIRALKMGAFLSVAQGSLHPPKLITLEYRGSNAKQKPIVFVGKGITFDTGGNSIKPSAGMIGMKYDMLGAATVMAVLKAAAELELPLNLVGVIPSAENMPGNSATRPEDIVTTLSGITVEILNTDAEGRLILCDALSYCARFNPEVVIDVGTLTGAAVMALGKVASALLSNYPPLAAELMQAGLQSGDKCWELPLWDEYQEGLNSGFADVANISTAGEAGTIMAACFLSRFTKNYHWAHLDVAATARSGSGKDRDATGRPLSLLVQYLLDRCKA